MATMDIAADVITQTRELLGAKQRSCDGLRMILSYFEDPADPFKLRMPEIYAKAEEEMTAPQLFSGTIFPFFWWPH